MVAARKPREHERNAHRLRRDMVLIGIGAAIGGMLTAMVRGGTYLDSGCLTLSSAFPKNNSSDESSTSKISSVTPHESSKSLPSVIPTGFNPIYSYFGKLDHLTDPIPEKWWLETSPKHKDNRQGDWFGQHGQDVAVAKFFNFRRNGFFVDLAANDAVWASNTFSLEQNFGWKGICIEANPVYWYRLSFRNCHAVGAIVGGQNNEEVEVTLGEAHQGPYGGIVGTEFDNKKKNAASQKRYTVSLETILEMFNAPKVIDYLSLDVEGAEAFIMRDFPFEKYRFRCLTIERPKDELKALLVKHGYKHVFDFKRGDTLWAHESMYAEGKNNTDFNPQEIHDHAVKRTIPGFG